MPGLTEKERADFLGQVKSSFNVAVERLNDALRESEYKAEQREMENRELRGTVKDQLVAARTRIAELESEKEDLEAAVRGIESPCGHSSHYAHTEDGGKHIICLMCRSERLDRENKELRMAARKLHTHPGIEKAHSIPLGHVVVDGPEYAALAVLAEGKISATRLSGEEKARLKSIYQRSSKKGEVFERYDINFLLHLIDTYTDLVSQTFQKDSDDLAHLLPSREVR